MAPPSASDVLDLGTTDLERLRGHRFEAVSVRQPPSVEAALNLSRIVSKLSPMVGNLIEFNTVEYLNGQGHFQDFGTWKRQDPGFPDTIFDGDVSPTPGFEIKAWFPLATEMTARFKDSQARFADGNISVAFIAWLPEFVIYGDPIILDVCVVSGLSVARARDTAYWNAPYYLIAEPGDTTERAANLQQSNTSGYVWQGEVATPEMFAEAGRVVAESGLQDQLYRPTPEHRALVRELMQRFPYRLDTNYAKADRIQHPEINAFTARVYELGIQGRAIKMWRSGLKTPSAKQRLEALTDAGVAAAVERKNARVRALLSPLLTDDPTEAEPNTPA